MNKRNLALFSLVLLLISSFFSCRKSDEELAPNIISTRWSMMGDVVNVSVEFKADRKVFITESSIFQNPANIIDSGSYLYTPPKIELFINAQHEIGTFSGDSLILPSGIFIKD